MTHRFLWENKPINNLFYLQRSTFTTTTPRSSFVAREMSTYWHISTRIVSPKPSNSAPCWRRAVQLTYVHAWCTLWTCCCRDAAKPTQLCVPDRVEQTNLSILRLQCCSGTRIQEDLCKEDECEDGPTTSELTFLDCCTLVTQQSCREKQIIQMDCGWGNEM